MLGQHAAQRRTHTIARMYNQHTPDRPPECRNTAWVAAQVHIPGDNQTSRPTAARTLGGGGGIGRVLNLPHGYNPRPMIQFVITDPTIPPCAIRAQEQHRGLTRDIGNSTMDIDNFPDPPSCSFGKDLVLEHSFGSCSIVASCSCFVVCVCWPVCQIRICTGPQTS